MTTPVQIPSPESAPPASTTPTRRALLAGALGALAALAASAIGRPSPVRAEGQAVVVGGEYLDATSTTKITNLTTGEIVLWGESSTGTGVRGDSSSNTGVYGQSSSLFGVQGFSWSGTGVRGHSNSGTGVYGTSEATNQPATIGSSFGNSTGVLGVSGVSQPAAKAKTGVFGYAAQDNFSRGVTGESPAGIGVYGISATGYGGYFGGRVYTTQFYELGEIGTPAAPLANRARLFVRDKGAGKTQLCVRFRTGAVQVIATQP